jgi:hypothetical protein
MIGTTGATILFVINLLFASVLGIAAGGVSCLVLHRPWGIKPAFMDATLAAVVAVIAAYVIGAIESASHVWGSACDADLSPRSGHRRGEAPDAPLASFIELAR